MNNNTKGPSVGKLLVWPSACTLAEGALWVYHGALNILFKYDFASNKTEYICSLKDETTVSLSLVKDIIWTKKGIYIIPLWGKHIHFYDFKKREDTIIPVPEEAKYWTKMSFSGAKIYGDYIYVVPHSYRYIISINTNDNSIAIEHDVRELLPPKGMGDINFIDTVFGEDGCLYSVVSGTNRIFKYDIKQKRSEMFSIGKENEIINSLSLYGDLLYVGVPDGLSIKIYDLMNSRIEKEVDVSFGNFIVRTLKAGTVIVDSIDTGTYLVMNSMDECQKRIRGSKSYVGEMEYPYSYGIVAHGDNDDCMYFDRYSYSIHKVDSQGYIEEYGSMIVADANTIPLFSKEPICESNTFNLSWFIPLIN